jgi:hypothetical protein
MRDSFDRIQQGMTRAEVEAILGPPEDFRSEPVAYPSGTEYWLQSLKPNDASQRIWYTDTGLRVVFFAPDGLVSGAVFVPGNLSNRSPLDNLLWRLKRLWHRWFS